MVQREKLWVSFPDSVGDNRSAVQPSGDRTAYMVATPAVDVYVTPTKGNLKRNFSQHLQERLFSEEVEVGEDDGMAFNGNGEFAIPLEDNFLEDHWYRII